MVYSEESSFYLFLVLIPFIPSNKQSNNKKNQKKRTSTSNHQAVPLSVDPRLHQAKSANAKARHSRLSTWHDFYLKSNIQQQSDCQDGPAYFPELLEVLLLGGGGDPLGGEDSTDAHFPEVVLGTPPKDAAQLSNRCKLSPRFHLRQIFKKLPLGEKPQQHRRVHVLPAPPAVDQPNRLIECRHNLFDLLLRPSQQNRRSFDHPLRFVAAAEKGVELVDNIGFAVLLGAQNFFFQSAFHSSICPRGGLGGVLGRLLRRLRASLGGREEVLALGEGIGGWKVEGKVGRRVCVFVVGVIIFNVLVVTLDLLQRGHACKAVVNVEKD